MPRLLDVALATFFLLFAATVLCLVGAIGPAALIWSYGLAGVAMVGALMVGDPDHGVRAAGAMFLGVAVLGAGLAVLVTPAHAAEATIAAPPGDTGLWASLNPYLADGLATLITGFVGWGATAFAAYTKVHITTVQEERVRQTLLTGAYKVAHELEVKLDGAITPAQRAKVLAGMVEWAEQRMPGPAGLLARLGLGQPVVAAIATKVLGQVLGELPVIGDAATALTALAGKA